MTLSAGPRHECLGAAFSTTDWAAGDGPLDRPVATLSSHAASVTPPLVAGTGSLHGVMPRAKAEARDRLNHSAVAPHAAGTRDRSAGTAHRSACLERTAQAGSLGTASFTTGGNCFAWGCRWNDVPAGGRVSLSLPGYLLSQRYAAHVSPLLAAGTGYRQGQCHEPNRNELH